MASPSLYRTYNITHAEAERTPRFSRTYRSGLGSPFLTTSDLPPDGESPHNGPSSSSRMLENDELEQVDGAFAAVPRALTVTRPPSPTPSFRTESYSIINWNPEYPSAYAASEEGAPYCLPPGRRTVSGYYAFAGPSPLKPSRSLTLGIARIWDALREGSPGKKNKRRPSLPSVSVWRDGLVTDDEDGIREFIDYLNMPPLDGEEGELIDDEACFINVTRVTGTGRFSLSLREFHHAFSIYSNCHHGALLICTLPTDIVGHLPVELALHLLSYLDLTAILACLRVSRFVYWVLPLLDNV